MIDIVSLMTISESFNTSAYTYPSVYNSMTISEACMYNQIELMESEIEYRDIMDEAANDMIESYYNQLHSIALTEAAENDEKEKTISWFTKVKNWIVNLFNKIIGWFKALGAKIAGLFKKKSSDTSSKKVEELEKEVKKIAASTPKALPAYNPQSAKDEKKEVKKIAASTPKALPAYNPEITFTIKYGNGFGIKNFRIQNQITNVYAYYSECFRQPTAVFTDLEKIAKNHAEVDKEEIKRINKLVSVYLEDKTDRTKSSSDMFLSCIDDVFEVNSKYSDYKKFFKDCKSSVETKEITINANTSLDDVYKNASGCNSPTPIYKYNEMYQDVKTSIDKSVAVIDNMKKTSTDYVDNCMKLIRNANITDPKVTRVIKIMASELNKEIGNCAAFVSNYVGCYTTLIEAAVYTTNSYVAAIGKFVKKYNANL